MKHWYGRALRLAVSVFVMTAVCAIAGTLDPTNAPGPTMNTLEEIYQNQVEIHQKVDTYANPLALSETTTVMRAGYYLSNDLVNVDGDLVTENIRAGITVFGVTGKTEVADTASGDAAAPDILAGKVAWVDGAEVVGTIPTRTLSDTSTVVNAGYYEGTTLSTVDTNLTSGNIRENVAVFGVTGSYGAGGYPASVPETGQTISYRTGDDGDLQPGVARPNPRFTDNGNWTVTDNLTGLIWNRIADYCGDVTWENAVGRANGAITEGFTDWRLPTLKELLSLVDRGHQSPALSNTAGTGQWSSNDPFYGVQATGHYWSSTAHSYGGGQWRYMDMTYGTTHYKGGTINHACVWAVRGGS